MKLYLILLSVLAVSAACARTTVVPPSPTRLPSLPPSPTPSPSPEPKRLAVCLPDEPDSLYLYGADSLAARHVWQAIYDGPTDNLDYGYQAVILTGVPSLSDGSAVVETIPVQAGDRVLAASGSVMELAPGVIVKDAAGKRVAFAGAPIAMERMVVTFTLRSDLRWADGEPLTAHDSLYSFQLAVDSATPTDKQIVERTVDYRAAGGNQVVWRGVPGFLDQAYFLNFWHPLPHHAWKGLSANELLTAPMSTREPLGWGPFAIREWTPGDHLTVRRNPFYFRAAEGLPPLDEVTFRFIDDPGELTQAFVAGTCDIVTYEAVGTVLEALEEASISPEWDTFTTQDAAWELLAFAISPAGDRPDLFEDTRVRQAIAHCVDRRAMAETVFAVDGRLLDSYVPSEHPLYAGEKLTMWQYDLEAGRHLLAQAGWYDEDGDGVREAHGVPGIVDGTPFRATYHTTDDPLRVRTAELAQAHLKECGIQINLQAVPSEALFAPGPEGMLFGRRFDLAQFSWQATAGPLCDLFLSSQVPGEGDWHRPNVAGFIDGEYDDACRAALEALPASGEYVARHIEAQRIFSERLPVLPLFQRQKATLARASVSGLAPNPSQPSELWNLEEIDVLR
jgi:peptide/nickel transport system substrate-binding protein